MVRRAIAENSEELQQETAVQDAQTEAAAQESAAQETAVQEAAAQESAAQETAEQEAATQETAAQETQEGGDVQPIVQETLSDAAQTQEMQTVSEQVTDAVAQTDSGEKEEGGFPFLIAAIVLVVVLLAAAVTALLILSKKKKKSRRNEWDDMWTRDGGHTVEEEPMMAEQAGLTRAEDDASVTQETPRTEPPKENDVSRTEMVQQTMGHPTYVIGRGATIGGREEQQDSFYCSNWTDNAVLAQRGLLVAVADGIGGLNDGALASGTAMGAMQSCFAKNTFNTHGSAKLLSLSAAAHAEVLRLNQSGHRCGCTLVTVLIEGWDMYMASVGDSRIYLYRAGGLIALNREHTLGRENDDLGTLSREMVSQENLKRPKAITSYLGKPNIRLIDRTIHPLKLLPGDKIALMSDGIFGTLSEDEMIAAMRKKPEDAVKDMINSIDARRDPRQDNATVVIIAVQ